MDLMLYLNTSLELYSLTDVDNDINYKCTENVQANSSHVCCNNGIILLIVRQVDAP